MELVEISRRLARRVQGLRFVPPVRYVYNPLSYAAELHEKYLERYGHGPKEVLLVGMNPGPFGMTQTGVPFGDVAVVRTWLGLAGYVGRPKREHPARPVLGLACRRSEVSGTRFWGWARATFGSADRFFQRFFVHSYCPLAFLEESGRNRTPDKLSRVERSTLFAACDEALRRCVERLGPRHVVGIGVFAATRAKEALKGADVRFGAVLHPSPASPLANRGWASQMSRQLTACGVLLPPS